MKLPDSALILTVRNEDDGTLVFTDRLGRYLTGMDDGELILADREEENGLSRWILEPVYGGWNLVNGKTAEDRNGRFAVQFYYGCFKTYRLSASDVFTMNFYECGTDDIPQQ